MIYRSEILKKDFATEADCLAAEKKFNEEKKANEVKKAERAAKRKEAAKEVELAYENMIKARDEYDKKLSKYYKDYCHESKTVSITTTPSDISSLIDAMFRFI